MSTVEISIAPASSRAGAINWAAFLGASWTWCIGMFLPVLLVRDYGFWGWLVFAVPNVIGAAAMGWVLRDADASRRVVAAHREAGAIFSAVTIAFHLFFIVAVLTPLINNLDVSVAGVLFAAAAMFILMKMLARGDVWLAWLALAVSMVAFGLTIEQIAHTGANLPDFFSNYQRSLHDLIWLAPVCCFGFGACPYLDLTFHRAHQSTTSPRIAFGVGFGVFFFAMIVFTLVYSSVFDDALTRWLGVVLFIHMAVQSAFTIAAHAREMRSDGTIAVVVAAVLTLAAWAGFYYLRTTPLVHGLRPGELIYRVFMGFYGLVFPAYVWIVMLRGRGRVVPDAYSLTIFAVAVAVAGPMFWMGFVAQRMIWLAPGLAIVLLARLLVRPPKGYADAAAL